MRQLLDSGAKVNSASGDALWTPLIRAARANKLEAVKFLIERKAIVDKVTQAGWTAFLVACYYGCTEAAATLLDQGADINLCGSHTRESGLMKAARGNRSSCVKLLLERKADKDLKSANSRTALELAQALDRREIVSLLQFASTAPPPAAPPAPAPRDAAAPFALRSSAIANEAYSKSADQNFAISSATKLNEQPVPVRRNCTAARAHSVALRSRFTTRQQTTATAGD